MIFLAALIMVIYTSRTADLPAWLTYPDKLNYKIHNAQIIVIAIDRWAVFTDKRPPSILTQRLRIFAD